MAFSTYFEAAFSPAKRRDSDGSEDVPVLYFRPFESAPKVIFKNVFVGQRASKLLILRNPQDETIEVELSKLPPPEVGITFSHKNLLVHPHQEVVLEVIWQPTKEGKCIYSVHLKTNTNSRFHFSIVCVSVPKKPMKKKSMVRTTTTKTKKVALKGISSQICQKVTTIVEKSAYQESWEPSPSTRIKTESCLRNQHPTDTFVETKVTPFYSTLCSKIGDQDNLLTVECDRLTSGEDLRNLSSETYDVVSPTSKDMLVNLKESTMKGPSSPKTTYSSVIKDETNLFSNFALSPVNPCSSFQPRGEESRETYSLPVQSSFLPPGQLSPISHHMTSNERYIPEMDVISEDSLSPITPAVNRNIEPSLLALSPLEHPPNISSIYPDVHGTPHTPQVFKTEMTLDFSLSPVEDFRVAGLDISGISEAEEESKKRFSDNKSTFEISLSCFTPLQVKKLAQSTDVTINETRDMKNIESCIGSKREIVSGFRSPCGSIHNTEGKFSATYLAFSPPCVFHRASKENISPQNTFSTNSRTFRRPLTTKSHQNLSVIGKKKDSYKLHKTKVQKELHYAIPKLLLNSKERKKAGKSVIMDTEKFLSEQTNPSYCITATIGNPFINSAVFYDQEWFDDREKEFVRWLNVLLTPPEQLNSNEELQKVDVAELWKKCCKTDVAPAPSRETVSSLYLVNHRLDSLRRKACNMFRQPSVAEVLSKVTVQIEKGILSMRKDRNVRDIGLKRTAIELLLCYNPLWLRIGLETVMGRTIPLDSNSDIVGIAGFIVRNILSDPYLIQRYSISGVTNMFKPGYDEAIKKHILKKFFLLVFFLDYAKENKLIVHNPCLFCKDAQYKESRDLLLAFARDFLSGIGDITKHLRTLGYVVKHKQNYLDEYNYAVTHLGSDLRDGVRLAKVAEIIVQDPSVCSCLRTPAISKLQKMHNVKVALTALNRAGHTIEGDITAKDIVEGHKEKTMSLLWQIIHKFQISRFCSAANKIQKWYRSLHICISRRIHTKRERAKRKEVEDPASRMIQKYWRGYVARKHYQMLKIKDHDHRKLQAAAVIIQRWFKSTRVMKYDRSCFILKKNSVVCIQKWYRNLLIKRMQRQLYLKQEEAAIVIQRRYRLLLDVKRHRNTYLLIKQTVVKIQIWYRACSAMKKQRQEYLKQVKAINKIQAYFKAMKQMRTDLQAFNKTRNAIKIIQFWYRNAILARKERCRFVHIQISVIKIQQWFRSIKLMEKQRKLYLRQQSAVVLIQRKFRARRVAQQQKYLYDLQKRSIVMLQKWYRSVLVMRIQRQHYLQKRTAIIVLQRSIRSVILGKKQRSTYLLQRNSALIIQRWYREVKQMHSDKLAYKRKLSAVKRIQAWFRGTILMRMQRSSYLKIHASVIKMQTWFRATKLMKDQRRLFLQQHCAALFIQRALRARVMAKKQWKLYVDKKHAIIKIQRWYRACVSMRYQRMLYVRQKNAAYKIQARFRAVRLLQEERMIFERKRMAVRRIQMWFRCSLLTRQQRAHYLHIYSSVVKIQIWFRTVSLMRQQRDLYLKQKNATIIIQQKFRATRVSRRQKHQYCLQRKSALKIQKWFRSRRRKLMQRQQYLEVSEATIYGHEHLRREVNQTPTMSTNLQAVERISQWYCSILLRRKQKEEQRRLAYHAAQQAFATKIQAYWRGYKARKELKATVLCSNVKPANTYTLDEGFSLRSLYYKGTQAFCSSSSYAVIQSAALLIECGVRLSPEICEEFLLSSPLDTLIFLLETMNRSVPAEKLLIILLKILTHALRHPFGVQKILQKEKTIPVLLNLTSIWCAKKHEIIFCYFCTVWWLLGQGQDSAQEIENASDVSVQLLKCYTKVKTWNTRLLRSSATPQKNLLPDLVPSWSIVKTGRPKMFESAKFAIIQVLKKLDINTFNKF